MKIGIFGGTFDPIHIAHLRVAEEVREGLGLSEVWFIPAGTPPHKRNAPHLPFKERLKLVELAIEGNPAFRVLDIEGRRQGPSYTVDTLTELRKSHLQYEFYFILGLDAFLEFETWHEYHRLPELAALVVINRGPLGVKSAVNKARQLFPTFEFRRDRLLGPKNQKILFLQVTPLEISSTLIRQSLWAGRSIRYLVPESVRLYIEKHRLYL
ncbi:nicotinate-nucleotide adenylyltransferase [Thermosulfurimonas dismutans]|uniref:Probable nicotinate-nucleotide adenylyltransferase n=1 Tax=Thermosulfurimonas dismutans TaxID=999894 RepID=A0A179D4M7_9BACT|nr:nicotinate-nucleotide adenylyltransferase [Thermosulfurimonas dismutans]OAQ21040.1 Nicotinate-nucleotide adenylyltransferase [Thermosulfurimonas dismutans]